MAKMIGYEYDCEFYLRVKHNFKVYVLISSKGANWNEDDVLEIIYRLNGYKCHKTVKYGKYSSHIHVKFEDDYFASSAVEFINRMNRDLIAVLVDEMLRDWFTYELRSGFGPPCTLAIVDVIGNTPFALNFLKGVILNSIFGDFGGPYLLPYTAALSETHVQVMFGSMTEALAACMAFGEWYDMAEKVDSFFYRVRINPSDKEGLLISNSGGYPSGAFKLDYFINLRSELQQSGTSELGSKLNKTTQTKSSSHSKGSHKERRHKHLTPAIRTAESQGGLSNQIAHRTPVLCIPVIAPMNYSEALMATNKQFGSGFVMDFQQCCSVSTRAIVSAEESNMDFNSAVQFPILEENPQTITTTDDGVKPDDQQALPAEPFPAEKIPAEPFPADQFPVLGVAQARVPPKRHQAVTKQKSTHKGHSRVFVRKVCR